MGAPFSVLMTVQGTGSLHLKQLHHSIRMPDGSSSQMCEPPFCVRSESPVSSISGPKADVVLLVLKCGGRLVLAGISLGLGTGPAWLVRCRTTAVLGNRHRRFWVGIPAGRLLSVLKQAPTGDLPEAAQRYFHPVEQACRANIGAGSHRDVRNRSAVGSWLSCHHGPKVLCPVPSRSVR
jgi:hypothetical protein